MITDGSCKVLSHRAMQDKPALPADAHRIIAREALRLCRGGLHAWLRLSLVCKDWQAALSGATLSVRANAPSTQ